jgi:hypothetical protein
MTSTPSPATRRPTGTAGRGSEAGVGSDAGVGSAAVDAAGAFVAVDGAASGDSTAGVGAPAASLVELSAEPDSAVVATAAVDVVVGSGWIETKRLSQIILFGAYHHFVKNDLN